MTTVYPLPARDMVYDLINESNPGLPQPLTAAVALLGTPTAITPGGGDYRNTQIKLIANGDSQVYIGKKTLAYRRIDLSALFRGMEIKIKKKSSREPGSSGSFMYTLYELLDDINAKYGLSLTTDDFVDASITRSAAVGADGYYYGQANLVCKPTSLAYIGSVVVKWESDALPFSEVVGNGILDGRSWPGGNDFPVGREPQGEYLFYGVDCSPQAATLNSWSSPGANNTGTQSFIEWLNSEVGSELLYNVAHTTLNGVSGLTRIRYTLPNAALPEANSAQFNRAMVFLSQEGSWFSGKMIFHYNA